LISEDEALESGMQEKRKNSWRKAPSFTPRPRSPTLCWLYLLPYNGVDKAEGKTGRLQDENVEKAKK